MKAPLPSDEEQRLAALHDYEILDTLPEQVFDDLTQLAAQICDVPISVVSPRATPKNRPFMNT